jgi:hypothetical protein
VGKYNKGSYKEPAFKFVAAESQGLDLENRKRPRVQFGEPFSKEFEPDLQFSPALNANVRHTLFDSLAPEHVLGAAKHTQGLTFLLKGVYCGHRCTIMLDTGASTCFVDTGWLEKTRESGKSPLFKI